VVLMVFSVRIASATVFGHYWVSSVATRRRMCRNLIRRDRDRWGRPTYGSGVTMAESASGRLLDFGDGPTLEYSGTGEVCFATAVVQHWAGLPCR
jgi:hypothetical protein